MALQLRASGLEEQTEYISFSLNICKEILRYQPKAEVAYLNGDLSPAEIKEVGLSGLDYNRQTGNIEKSSQIKQSKFNLSEIM